MASPLDTIQIFRINTDAICRLGFRTVRMLDTHGVYIGYVTFFMIPRSCRLFSSFLLLFQSYIGTHFGGCKPLGPFFHFELILEKRVGGGGGEGKNF